MRFVIAVIVAGLCSLSSEAEDWTVAGNDYHNVKVGQVEADRVHITYDGGVGTVMLSDLTPELQKRFGYDPAAAKKAALEAQAREAASDAMVVGEGKPEWEKVKNPPLLPWVSKVEQTTESASTPTQKMEADNMQERLSILHEILDVAEGKSKFVGNGDGESEEIVDLREAAKILSTLPPDQVQSIVDDYMNCSICVGMPKGLAILAWGPPDTVDTNSSLLGSIEILNYHHGASSFTVSKGVVVDVTQANLSP